MRNKADITNINSKAPITGIAGVTCSARYGQLEKKKENHRPEILFSYKKHSDFSANIKTVFTVQSYALIHILRMILRCSIVQSFHLPDGILRPDVRESSM